MNEEEKPPSNMDSRAGFIPASCSMVRRFKDCWGTLASNLGIHPVGRTLPSGFLIVLKDIQEGLR
jgi:hypothetical protein